MTKIEVPTKNLNFIAIFVLEINLRAFVSNKYLNISTDKSLPNVKA